MVLRINGHDVLRSEFEYNFNKNNAEGVLDKKNLDEYVNLFINYKRKVEAAKEAGYDTLTSFLKEFRTYRDQQIRPLLVTPEAEDAACRNYYERMKESIGPAGLILPAHIFVHVPQQAPAAVQAAGRARIDSIYAALQAGAPFDSLATYSSDDKGAATRAGELGWIGPRQTLPEFEEQAYKLQKGDISVPFQSTVGWHIVWMKDRKQVEPYEELKPQIQPFLERRGIKDQIANAVVDSMSRASGGALTVEQVMDREAERLAAQDLELKYLIQEYYDGLLLYEISNRKVWDKAAKDTLGLERYFKKNKRKYKWDEPRYSGIVYHCRTAEQAESVKKMLKRVDESEWVSTLRKAYNSDSVLQMRVEKRLFKPGENAWVDSLVFDKKNANAKVQTQFPYSGVYGKKLKKPRNWVDVKNEVVLDYQNLLEEEFRKWLMPKYEVIIYRNVLNTVNKH